MWEKTTKLGCAVAQCPNGYVYACHYSPPGNFMGQAMFQDENFQSVCKREPGWRSCGLVFYIKCSISSGYYFEESNGFSMDWDNVFYTTRKNYFPTVFCYSKSRYSLLLIAAKR